MSDVERTTSNGGRSVHRRNSSNRDLEAQKSPAFTPQTPTFPGALYGFNPSDQPSVPARRVPSSHSLKFNKSITSIGTTQSPPPPLPAPFITSAQQHQTPSISQTANTTTTYPHEQQEDDNDNESSGEELAWGPSHPCFPHLNPHVPLMSNEYQTTRIIRIRRDWMIAGDLAPTFSNVYPEILDPLLPENQFRYIIEHVNKSLTEAFDPFNTWNWIDGFLGLITGWFWEDFRPNLSRGILRDLEKWMEEWNERVGWKDGVRIISLRRTAYMGLDIQIPDPQVRVVNEDEELEHQRLQQQQQLQQFQQQQSSTVPTSRGNPSASVVTDNSQSRQFGHITSEPMGSR